MELEILQWTLLVRWKQICTYNWNNWVLNLYLPLKAASLKFMQFFKLGSFTRFTQFVYTITKVDVTVLMF